MKIHEYSSDHGERNRILIVIGSLSVVAAWILHFLLGRMPFSVPWWLDVPSVWGFFGLLNTWFDRRLWQMAIVRKVLFVTTPNLNGYWKGQLLSSHDNHSSPLDAELTIFQTWTNILISLETVTSISSSRVAAFVIEQPGRISLIYEYLCEPRGPTAKETMHAHHGTGELHIKSGDTSLEGGYYTGRDRETHGSLNFHRISLS